MAIARQALTLLAAAVLLLLSSCNLEKEVSIELPSYLSEPVVECYLEPGKPYRLLLTRAYGYFETLDLGNPAAALINDATVIIRYDDREIPLANGLYIDPAGRKVFNYGSEELVPEEAGREFSLEIVLADGNRLEALGMGDREPRADNRLEEGRLMNRRVEVKLTRNVVNTRKRTMVGGGAGPSPNDSTERR